MNPRALASRFHRPPAWKLLCAMMLRLLGLAALLTPAQAFTLPPVGEEASPASLGEGDVSVARRLAHSCDDEFFSSSCDKGCGTTCLDGMHLPSGQSNTPCGSQGIPEACVPNPPSRPRTPPRSPPPPPAPPPSSPSLPPPGPAHCPWLAHDGSEVTTNVPMELECFDGTTCNIDLEGANCCTCRGK